MEENGKKEVSLWPFIIGSIIIAALWVGSWLAIRYKYDDWGTRGTFGDSFGAINSLFSGLAFAGIIYTILLQRKELALQREELRETKNELKRTADAQEKSEKALQRQIKSMNQSARLNALNGVMAYHTSQLNDEQYLKGFASLKAKKISKRIEEILKEIENEELL